MDTTGPRPHGGECGAGIWIQAFPHQSGHFPLAPQQDLELEGLLRSGHEEHWRRGGGSAVWLQASEAPVQGPTS